MPYGCISFTAMCLSIGHVIQDIGVKFRYSKTAGGIWGGLSNNKSHMEFSLQYFWRFLLLATTSSSVSVTYINFLQYLSVRLKIGSCLSVLVSEIEGKGKLKALFQKEEIKPKT